MAHNPSAVGKKHSECTETDDLQPEGGEPPRNFIATSATANQNGDQPGCGDGVMPEQEGTERRRSVQVDPRTVSGSLLPGQRPSFQIPRKTRERKGLYNFLPPDSREFEDLVKIVSSCYLDSSSRGTFTYCKARLIRNELLEKEFIEKRREMKQEGRTEQELSESFCFLYPDKSKVLIQTWICEKGLAVGHSRITTLGNPSVGVYLSKYSDLLQINPFEVGSYGDMIVFKVMRVRLGSVLNMPKNAIEPSPKFDSHVSKSANRVTSPLSYRAFELTQQYFFEFAFDEIKARPRHLCPYAVVSFQYKGKESTLKEAVDGFAGKSCYTVWSGPLVNKGQELFPICLRSSARPYLPFKLPEKLEVTQGMQLEQVKRKIPSVLFSWDTYSASREVMKCGMSCSLFEVVDGKGKPTSGSLAALVNKLERDRMVLVKSLYDRGFLFLLSSTQMVESKGSAELFLIFSCRLNTYPLPWVKFSLLKVKYKKVAVCFVERWGRLEKMRPFILPDYKYTMDDRTSPLQIPRPKFNMDSVLRAYIHNPASYILPLNKVKENIERLRNPVLPDRVLQERPGEDGAWDTNILKRKYEGDEKGGANKHKRLDPLCNGESSRGGMGIYDTDLRAHGNDGSTAVNETQHLLKILLTTLKKAVSQGSFPVQTNKPSAGSVLDSEPDLKQQKELVSQTNYTEFSFVFSHTERAHELESKSEPAPAPEVLTASDGHPEPKMPAGVEVKKVAAPSTLATIEDVPSRPSISLDTILNQEVYSLTSDIKNIMQTHHISYASQLPHRLTPRHGWLPNSCFSGFVVPYVSPVPCHGHVKTLCEKMDRLIPPLSTSSGVTSPGPPLTASSLATPPSTPNQSSKAKPELLVSKSASCSHSGKMAPVKETKSTKAKTEAPPAESGGEIYSPSQVHPDISESKSQNSCSASGSGSGLLAGSLIGQLKPEVFSSLVEIFKDVTKNTVKFYIYSGDEWEESDVCKDIKEYLKSLGNSECSPQTFLENSSSLDKLLIIIRNEDIAAHVHKIPALVSLKKLPSVSFAGVDSLDDVKNHTYNELFVSGGFIVSDEFVLNPDLITQERLQGLLKFLEEQSTPEHPWHWKVHCKSQKKLKELGRLNTNAMGLLNLLTAYQKKHLVEFLPYHECDTQSRQAPDLECLIKLQAQHTQQRHLIFLTERPFEMFLQYSRNGIVIGSIDDVMSGFHSLIGSINQNELPTPPSTGE
uniref:Transcription activation suppressor b n=1 Tax=Takifugu rubripes TaxID=31033 RepID=H2SS95_TAKRU